ncbi:alkaline phosphatase D family protein [Halopseudomonas bauzanensis]|uniref:PhoD-like phosphatase n=1 Tax=Halopseudomonas bauzanensis TaxID=653930 RepID=A0A1I4NHI8_9GAMM|nr:alkaline phosphatase D family protein [Halopseudomonas bauzanensis]SES21536.1 PhoD-like phosphatase [Halopseudomonas bauzanensis]SFM14643.1 PhoD-like phosphatase [Halopseudomonas bauzanensis]
MTQVPIPDALPPVLAGPILRRLEPGRLVLWLVGSTPLHLMLELEPEAGTVRRVNLDSSCCRVLPIGRHAYLHLVDVSLPEPLPQDTLIHYDLIVALENGVEANIAQWAPHLLHEGATRPSLVLRSRADDILYGSCRKPHHPARDGLARADSLLAEHIGQADARPAMLMLCGDQVYADDVAGPMLAAVHALIRRLGLYGESLEGAVVTDSEELYAHPAGYYRREELLPAFKSNEALRERFFGGVEKPIFTTANAHNHLVTLAEVMAMYLLVWSPVPWQLVSEPQMPALDAEHMVRWQDEADAIRGFCRDLPQAARLFAHIQTLMIFDDHDITDDWNLSAKWESTAYGHPFSRRIMGNALLAYMLCQGWGNRPDVFAGLLDETEALTAALDSQARLDAAAQDALIGQLLAFNQWDYVLRTHPTVIVLDTRTRRWRSRRLPSRPSGLMNWESLVELQHELLDETAAVIVSPTPMFGVKLIEVIQRICAFAGHALTVDAENWMAHRGAANVMLNIFRHSRTPGNYVVLSGDVHYSFAYDVQVRDRERAPHIWQITSSGIKNEFPRRLLDWLDRLNRWLYSPRSPLNWFTQRRDLKIRPRLPDQRHRGERVWNGAGIGQVLLDAQGRPTRILQHNADGRPSTQFLTPGASTAADVTVEQRGSSA